MRLGPSGVMDLPKHIVDDSADHIIYIHPAYECEQETIQFDTPFWESNYNFIICPPSDGSS